VRLGEIAAHHDPPDAETADDHYRQARMLAEALGMRPLVAHCHLGLGKLYLDTREQAKAEEHLTTAATMYREMDIGLLAGEGGGGGARAAPIGAHPEPGRTLRTLMMVPRWHRGCAHDVGSSSE
jgi:hypothetical protein